MINKRSIIKNKLKLIGRFLASVIHSVFLFLHRVLKLVLKPIRKIWGKLITRLPHKWRMRIFNFQKKLEGHSRMKTAGAFAFTSIVLVVFGVFIWNQYNNNKQFATNDPWNEKIAEGAWILHNMIKNLN